MVVLPETPFRASQSSMQNLREWRAQILDGILRGVLVIWLFALASGINNVVKAYRQEQGLYANPLALAISIIVLYLAVTALLSVITFNRKIRYQLRAALLLFVFYLIGAIGLALSSLSGDGRIFLFTFIILTAVLFDVRYSLLALGISLATLIVMGWLEVSQTIVVPAERQLNAANASAWLSGGLVFFVLSVAVLISVAYILRGLEQVYEQTQAKFSEMESLYAASQDMASSLLDTDALLKILARHMTEALSATSGYIVSINQSESTMRVLAEYWGETVGANEHQSDLGRVYSLRAYPAIARSMFGGEALTLHADDENLSEAERRQFMDYGIRSMLFVPIIAHGKLIGDFEIWESRRRREFTLAEIRLAQAMAGHAGNAIENGRLYEQTIENANELSRAYDSTLAGWARALELRDELTEGHTRRVTEVTIQLARRMGLSEDELIQVRRGATLHDIGKMAVPDSILHKTGPLDENELRIIRLHPQHAFDMLSSISFLRPALDIPYCHHEHWDGGGYPRGLKGEEIPLTARIFAIADVWDALTSDRPYRTAWSKEKTIEYIKENSGKYFDPQVVKAFLAMPPELN